MAGANIVDARIHTLANGMALLSAAASPSWGQAVTLPAVGDRELRLDLFRGLALWLIFIDHLPVNILTWLTIRNYGFSDATEIFQEGMYSPKILINDAQSHRYVLNDLQDRFF